MKFIFTTILLLISISSFAQKLIITGKVVDSLNQPIEYANVVAIDPETKSIVSFSITNTDGKFKLQLVEDETCTLKISFVGFQTFEQEFTPSKELTENIVVELAISADYLDEVQVVQEMPVMMSGDTLIYKTDTFTDGRERKLEDVLEKLPGIEVDENGEVSVQGKKVNKVLVDGKQFFDGDTKMATKNIPANAVDRVQVLKDYNEVSPMNGMRGADNLALNIQLKEDKKNIVFGDLTAGLGPQERFLGHANIFYYSPKFNINLITDANNIGDLAFTIQDYFRFSGGLSNFTASSGSEIKLSNESLGFPLADKESAKDLSTQLGALNFTYIPNKKWSHTGFALGSQSKNEFGSASLRTYLRDDIDNTELLNSSLFTSNRSGLLKYSTTYTPNVNTHLQYAVFGKINALESLNNRISQFAQSENTIFEVEEQFTYSIDQQLMLYHTLNEKNIFALETSFKHNLERPNFNVRSDDNPFPNLLNIIADSVYQLFQSKNVLSNHLLGESNYYRIINKKNHLNFSAGFNYLNQKMSSGLELNGGELNGGNQDRIFQNDLSYQLTDIYSGLSLKSKLGNFTIKPGLFIHRYDLTNLQNEELATQKIDLILPSFFTKWELSSIQSLSFRYAAKAEFVDIQKLAEGIILTDYNALFRGNRFLENGIYHSGNLYYNYFNFFAGMNMYVNLSAMRKMNDFGNQVRFEGVERINSLVNLEQANESFQSQLGFDKKFKLFSMNAAVNFSGYRNNSFVNESLNENQSFNQSYRVTLKTTLLKNIKVEGGYQYQFNIYESTQADNAFANHKPYLKLNWNVFRNFDLMTDYHYNYYINKGSNTSSSFDILNATLSYHQKSKPWEFSLSAYNLLDTKGVRRDSFNENLISTYEYFIQPRYFMLSVKYDL